MMRTKRASDNYNAQVQEQAKAAASEHLKDIWMSSYYWKSFVDGLRLTIRTVATKHLGRKITMACVEGGPVTQVEWSNMRNIQQ